MTRTCMFKFLKCHIEYLAKSLQPAKCIAKEQNVIMNPTPGKSINLPPTVGQKKKNNNDNQSTSNLSLMLKKKYDNASSQNEVIANNISAFRKSSEKNLNQRRPLSAAVYV